MRFVLQMDPKSNALPLRDAVELMQRFDMEGNAVLTTAEGAHNDEPGEWTVTATDLFTFEVVTVSFLVE